MEVVCIAPLRDLLPQRVRLVPSADTSTTAASEGSIGTGLGALPSSRGDPGRAGESRETWEW